MQKLHSEQRVVSPAQLGCKDAIGNGLETVCGAGEMRRDKLRVRGKIVYGLGSSKANHSSSSSGVTTHGCTKPFEHINHILIHSSDS